MRGNTLAVVAIAIIIVVGAAIYAAVQTVGKGSGQGQAPTGALTKQVPQQVNTPSTRTGTSAARGTSETQPRLREDLTDIEMNGNGDSCNGPLFWTGTDWKNCSYLTHHECEGGKILTIAGICGENGCEEKTVEEQPCNACRTVKVWGKNDAVCLKSPEDNVIVLECGKDNEENACCCYITHHTYTLKTPVPAQQIWIKFKPGYGAGCPAEVSAVIKEPNGKKTVIQANKALGHVVGYMHAELNGMRVSKVRVIESAGCYLDKSAVIIETGGAS